MIKKSMTVLLALTLVAGAYELNIESGWQLVGALDDIQREAFDVEAVDAVWRYEGGVWKLYMPHNPSLMQNLPNGIEPLSHIQKGEGFWVLAHMPYSLDTNVTDLFSKSYITTVDPLQDFSVSDVANKTFREYTQYPEYDLLQFDSNGVASIRDNVVVRVEDGMINAYYNDRKFLSAKKLAQDENGIIYEGVMFDLCDENATSNFYIDALLSGDLEPVDMSTKIPYTIYDWYGSDGYRVFDTDGKVKNYYDGHVNRELNYTIKNGKIISGESGGEYQNEANQTVRYSYSEALQIVKSIGRYDVIQVDIVYKEEMNDPKLVGKDWDFIVQNQIPVFNLILNPDGTAHYQQGNSPDENITYTISGDTLTLHESYCFQQYECIMKLGGEDECVTDTYTLTLDSQNGVISKESSNFKYLNIVSSSPIAYYRYSYRKNSLPRFLQRRYYLLPR